MESGLLELLLMGLHHALGPFVEDLGVMLGALGQGLTAVQEAQNGAKDQKIQDDEGEKKKPDLEENSLVGQKFNHTPNLGFIVCDEWKCGENTARREKNRMRR